MSKVHLYLFSNSHGYPRYRYINYTACGLAWENSSYFYSSKENYNSITEKADFLYANASNSEIITCEECLVMTDALLSDGVIRYAKYYNGQTIFFIGKYSGNNRLKTFKSYLAKFGKTLNNEITFMAHVVLQPHQYSSLPATEEEYYRNEDDYNDDGDYYN